MRQAVQRARPRACPRTTLAVGRADLGDAGDVQQLAAASRLKLAPQLIGAAQQRHVGRMLEIAEPDDAGFAVRGAAVVARREALDAEHARAAPRQLRQRRAAHRAEADHDHVELRHRPTRLSRSGPLFKSRLCSNRRRKFAHGARHPSARRQQRPRPALAGRGRAGLLRRPKASTVEYTRGQSEGRRRPGRGFLASAGRSRSSSRARLRSIRSANGARSSACSSSARARSSASTPRRAPARSWCARIPRSQSLARAAQRADRGDLACRHLLCRDRGDGSRGRAVRRDQARARQRPARRAARPARTKPRR